MTELLAWYEEMGVDTTIEDTPIDHTKATLSPPSAPSTPAQTTEAPTIMNKPPATTAPTAPTTPTEAIAIARHAADAADSLEALRHAVETFEGCSIKKTANNTVFCDGKAESDIMFIGEAPGANEDIEGIPFCGASGKLLDQMIECIGLSRQENCYITNTLFWRPPGNRRPTPEEIAMCRPFVEKHIALFKPKLIILVGGTAIASVLNSKLGITKMRGKFYDYTNHYLENPIQTTVLFHPSYLLRSPGQKKHAWHDLIGIKHYLHEQNILPTS